MAIFGLLFLLHLRQVISSGLAKSTYILSRDCQVPINSDPLLTYQNTKHLRIDDVSGGIVLYSHEGFMHSNNGSAQSISDAGSSSGSSNGLEPSLSTYSNYPRDFSCEVVVHTPVDNAKIMLHVDSFYIPSSSDDCVENYLYVFDSNTAKSKAMPEAGGERGLCRSFFPRQPIYTTKSYICIAFHTSQHWPTLSSAARPGFRLVLTAIRETTTATCQPGGFYCGPRIPLVSPSPPASGASHPVILLPPSALLEGALPLLYPNDYTGTRSGGGGLHMTEGDLPRLPMSGVVSVASGKQQQQYRSETIPSVPHTAGFCVSQQTVCDGVINCADGRDEIPSRCRGGNDQKISEDTSVGPKLSTVNSVSIAIAVCTIIIFTVCIGSIICCCHRCCHGYQPGGGLSSSASSWRRSHSSGHTRHVGSNQLRHHPAASRGQQQQGSYQGTTVSMSGWPQSWNTSGATAYLPDHEHQVKANRQLAVNWQSFPTVSTAYPTGYVATSAAGAAELVNYGQLDPAGHFFCPLNAAGKQLMLKAAGSLTTDYDSHQVGLPPGSGGLRSIGGSESLVSSEHYSCLRTATGGNGTCPYTYPPVPPGPPPALRMGGSPTLAMRRDPIGLEMCCYTPPLYSGFTVPPASSVTASGSSRTGTISGQQAVDWPLVATRGPTSQSTAGHPLALVELPSGGPSCSSRHRYHHRHHHHHHHRHRHSQNLSGSAQSALHTNTPVEAISQTGANDLTANGGILYLGEVFHPEHSSASTSYSADQLNPLRMPPLGAPNSSNSNTAATTPTTESGGSNNHNKRFRSHPHRLLLPSSSSTITTTQFCPVESPGAVTTTVPISTAVVAQSGRSRGSARRHRRCCHQPSQQHHSRRSNSTTRPNSRHRCSAGSPDHHSLSSHSNQGAVAGPPHSPGLAAEQTSRHRPEPVSFPVQL